jgi:hypothetical protein
VGAEVGPAWAHVVRCQHVPAPVCVISFSTAPGTPDSGYPLGWESLGGGRRGSESGSVLVRATGTGHPVHSGRDDMQPTE